MLSENTVNKVLEQGCTKGADFTEVFVEDSESSVLTLLDEKIDNISSGNSFGVGVRLLFGDEAYYGYSNDPSEETLLRLTEGLALAKGGSGCGTPQPLQHQQVQNSHTVQRDPGSVPKGQRVDLLRRMNELSRNYGPDIKQVNAVLSEKKRSVLIANSEGLWVEDSRQYARARLAVIAEKRDGPQSSSEGPGVLGGYEFFENLDLEAMAEEVATSAIRMAGAGYIDGGAMPVVLGNAFGGVIFHEACGHPLETEAIRKGASPFAGKLGEQVANPVLTAIDDGTMENRWGSLNVDDEGMPTQRTVLIENGILKNYLSDRIGARQVGVPRTGSGRRESYKFAPVSRMRNTYIAAGPDNLDDMLASMDFGLYAKKMGGGSVNPATGEFNFSVQEGYIVKNGRIAEAVRGITLIGKGYEVLPRISMIGSDLELAAGICGASSGQVPTTVGQPSLKIDKILVGGR